MYLGKKLREQRESHNISQRNLSKKTGISQQNISRWENDISIPSIENCIILADFYEITIDELIDREIKKNW